MSPKPPTINLTAPIRELERLAQTARNKQAGAEWNLATWQNNADNARASADSYRQQAEAYEHAIFVLRGKPL